MSLEEDIAFDEWMRRRLLERENATMRRAEALGPVVCEPCQRADHLMCTRPCSCRIRVRAAAR